MDKYYALALLAHPDDESFLMAGTFLHLADQGKKIGLVCATKGDKGTNRQGLDLASNTMAQKREQELQQACNLLGCHCLACFDYADGGLKHVNKQELAEKFARFIDQCQPEIILTFGPEGITGHYDHIAVYEASILSVRLAKHKIKQLWLASIPQSDIEQFNHHLKNRKVHHDHYRPQALTGVADHMLYVLDISRYAKMKHQAIKTHASQYLPEFVLKQFLDKECYQIMTPDSLT